MSYTRLKLKNWIDIAIVAGAMVVFSPTFARDPAAVVNEATNEVAAELAVCAAY